MELKNKIAAFLQSLRKYWKTPPEGRYMSYREILSLSGGGIGVRLTVWCFTQMTITVGNTLIGNTIGIEPRALYSIYIISLITAFPLTALRSSMIDNTRSMKGKYRPYLLMMGLPTAILGSLFIWMPYENMSLTARCITVLGFNIAFQFFFSFFNDSYDSLINVLSPNSIERSDVLSVKSIVENISPSIVNIIFPILAKLITGENTLYDIKIYRVIYPPSLVFGFLMSLIIYFNTEEKIVQAKSHFIRVKFIDAFKAVTRNKYFWIISLAGWLGFLENSFNNIIQWMYNYQNACTAGQYSLITAIAGNASFWPNLVAPFFIRKYGKKKILIATNLLNIGCIAVMLPVVRMTGSPRIIWMLLFCIFVNTFITALSSLMNPSVNADIRDYQQYVSGERIDGMFAAVGLIGNLVTMVTSSVLPMIYNKTGLNAETAVSLGYDGTNVYDVLYDKGYFIRITSVLIIASVIGAAMNVIPLFFYDFTETKQQGVVKVLKLRAAFEDLGNGILKEEDKAEAAGIIREAREYSGRTPFDLKAGKAALKTKKGEERKHAKAELKEKTEFNRKIEISAFIMNELNKYNTEDGRKLYAEAKAIADAGLGDFLSLSTLTKQDAKKLPAATETEKEARKRALRFAADMKTSVKAAAKYYPDGIEEFDMSVFEKLFAAEDENEAELSLTAKKLKAAKETKDRDSTASLKEEYAALRRVKKEIAGEIKKATEQNSIYHRAAKPYIDAVNTVKQKENYELAESIIG